MRALRSSVRLVEKEESLNQFFLKCVSCRRKTAVPCVRIPRAKLITGIDPQAEASDIRAASLELVNQLQT